MSPRWNWDFEDEQRAAKRARATSPKPPQPDPQPDPPDDGRARFRRRRLGAALAFAVVLIVVVIVLVGSHHGGSVSTASTHADATTAASPRAAPPVDALERGEKAVDSVLAYTPFVKSGGTQGHDIALTFDDGPGPYTPGVLNVLEREHVPATFFVIGEELRYFSASTVREIHDGFVIGDHTETHPMMAQLSKHDQHEELFEQAARIELLGGRRPRLFRPPYGSFDATTFHLLHQMHMLMVLWSVDTDDYERPGVAAIVDNALEGAKPGAIILMHDAGGDRSETIEALPTIIRELRKRGFHLVTVPQLLLDDPPPAGQPLPQNLSGD
ncbi:MAG TPA: polysaccharide deacetylase family protein [Solirubrobacteraceae bacterium]|jgi:peptidoglycan/xylan/chitin deacetylase (PgdA/CDA1 family)|nr:polysaccharide deacetylase family protein [Solirubrobacteraceae bacterium]